MQRKKITRLAIDYIVEKRNDRTANYTFAEISNLLKKEYDIDVIPQTVARNYHKHKDDDVYKEMGKIVSLKSVSKEKLNNESKEIKSVPAPEVPKKAKSKRVNEPIIPVTVVKDFNEDAGKNYDVNDFFMKK